MPYEVFMFNVPKVSDDGQKAIPVAKSETRELEDLEAAKQLAAERKDEFDRVVVISRDGETQKMVERYIDGQREEREQAA
jgi:hypothetical protein